jgi:uncharacterized protein
VTFLLDVNVLISLIDRKHAWHETAHDWFARQGMAGWATCPLVENGIVRIVGRQAYPNYLGTPGSVVELLRDLRRAGHHVFWPDDISLLDEDRVLATRLSAPSQITDTYLLALAANRGGKLATFDRRLSPAAVKNGAAALHLIA